MNAVFADTFAYVAYLDASDAHHQRVSHYLARHTGFIVTTRWVLAETAEALCYSRTRGMTAEFLRDLENDSSTHMIKGAEEWYHRGMTLYMSRPDKDWSLTDCISFLVMREFQVSDALTRDHHFEQAGLRALFADGPS